MMKVIFVLYFININQLYKLNKTQKLLNVYGFNFFSLGRNQSCLKICYIFQNSTNNTTNIYNISKYTLLKNLEARILFNSVRTGIYMRNNFEVYNDKIESFFLKILIKIWIKWIRKKSLNEVY